jgi:hypothetical protein
MPLLADWIQLVGNTSITISAVSGSEGVPVPLNGNPFNTAGRNASQTALLMFSVRDLIGSAKVFINDTEVGTITKSEPGFWSTQMISVPGNVLKENLNKLVLKSVTDQFSLKNFMCFFHQEI